MASDELHCIAGYRHSGTAGTRLRQTVVVGDRAGHFVQGMTGGSVHMLEMPIEPHSSIEEAKLINLAIEPEPAGAVA